MSDDAVVAMATPLFILNSKWLRKSHIILWSLPGDRITNIKSCILIYFLLLSSFPLFFQSEKAFELRLALVPHWDSELERDGPEQKPDNPVFCMEKKVFSSRGLCRTIPIPIQGIWWCGPSQIEGFFRREWFGDAP